MTLIKLASDETLVGLERVQEPSEEEGDEDYEVDADAVDADDAPEAQAAGDEEAQQE
ncbi:hypothetical protein D3C72_1393640 [compost metagenome]